MGDITQNLSRWEFACKCGCGFDTVDFETADVAQDVVDHFMVLDGKVYYVKVHSGCRCEIHNEAVQIIADPHYVPFTSTSTHMEARGIDFSIPGVHPYRIYVYLSKKYPNKYGIGKHDTFVHLDTKSGPPRRW